MITVTKEQAKAIWDIYTANKKEQSVSFSPLAGIDVTLTYEYTFSPRYGIDFELTDSKVKLSKELQKFSDNFGINLEYFVQEIQLEDYVSKRELNALCKAFDKARNAIPEQVRRALSYTSVGSYGTFEKFWKEIQAQVEVLNAPAPTVVILNRTYSAKVTKGSKDVKVGCQTIPIESIKELARVIESVNA